MAVFYKWIKGCAEGASLTEGQWSYIEWGKDAEDYKTSGSNSLYYTDIMPTLKASVGRKAEDGELIDLGYFLTSKMPTPLIQTDFRFNHTVYFTDSIFTEDTYTYKDTDPQGWIQMGLDAENQKYIFHFCSNNNLNIDATQSMNLYSKQDFTIKSDAKINIDCKSLNITTETGFVINSESTFKENITIDGKKLQATNEGYIEATYFNATSDKRAKENITPATYSALNLINKLPIYTFNYKNQKEIVTGILAQDLLETQPEELDLVSNINATGENNDYMSIKNDKLIFVLMKAIQEQQEQIELLKSEVEKLSKN